MAGIRKAVAAFGFTKKLQARRLYEWTRRRMGLAFDADGKLGSGVFLRMRNGHVALLTARHVVVAHLLSGDLTMQSCLSKEESFAPGAITVDPSHDAALLYVPVGRHIPHFLEERDLLIPAVRVGDPIVCNGAPGEWKSPPDLLRRTFERIKVLHYMTATTAVSELEIVCDVDEGEPALPSSFGGMSGGPATTLDRALVGINVRERRDIRPGDGVIEVLPLEAFRLMLSQDELLPGPRNDYVGTRRETSFVLTRPGPRARHLVCVVRYMHCESLAAPNEIGGRVAVVTKLLLQPDVCAESGRAFPIDVLHRVPLMGQTRDDEIDALALATVAMLGLGGWDRDRRFERPPPVA
jgi:hypothetical protein